MPILGKVFGTAILGAIVAGALWLGYLWTHPFRPQYAASDKTMISPDGTLVASQLVDDHYHGLGSPPWFGVVISQKGRDPLDGEVVVFGGDFLTHWSATNQLDIVPYCDGWIDDAKKEVEVADRKIVVRLAPMSQCQHTPYL